MNNLTTTFKSFINMPTIQQKLTETLGDKAVMFATNLNIMVTNNTGLANCDNASILGCALQAEALGLPMSQSLGYAYAVPYGGKAQFQIGYKGFIQLAIRSGQYKSLKVLEIKEGEFKGLDAETGDLTFNFETDYDKRTTLKTIGIRAYFELTNGFKQTIYMSNTDIQNHGKKFSKTFNNGPWKTNYDEMAKKTVIKRLLSKWGIMSIELQQATTKDQASIDTNGNHDYIDNPDNPYPTVIDDSKIIKPKLVTV